MRKYNYKIDWEAKRETQNEAQKSSRIDMQYFTVKYCPECNSCYDSPRPSYKKNKKTGESVMCKTVQSKLKDFPSIGLERKTCKECENKREIIK